MISTRVKGSAGTVSDLDRAPSQLIEDVLGDDNLVVRGSDQDGIACLLFPIGNGMLS